MNRKDFDLLAGVVKTLYPNARNATANEVRGYVAMRLANAIERADQCAGFDREKFLERCGVP